jgi:hypothetical protein
MGIDTTWKNFLSRCFGWPEMPSAAAQSINVVIDDISLNIRRILAGVQTWDELAQRVRDRVHLLVKRGTLKEYWMLWDESRFVPENKAKTQRDRAAAAMEPFTEGECASISVGHGSVEQLAKSFTPKLTVADFFTKLMATRSLHSSLYTFITAEVARMDLPEGVVLCLDGVRAQGIVDRKLRVRDRCDTQHAQPCSLPECQYNVTFANIKVPKGIFDVPAEIVRGRLERQGVIKIRRQAAENTNIIYVNESRGVGESDLKIPAIIAGVDAGSNIFVRSCDGDMLAIFMLHMRNYICTSKPTESEVAAGIKYGMCKYGIYVDTEGPGRKPGSPPVPVLDIVELWRCTHRKFHELYVTVPYPAETLAVLMLLTGSDYADRFPRIGPGAVWKAFNNPEGRALLFPPDSPRTPAVFLDDVRGQPDTRINIRLEERRLLTFVTFMYHTLGTKHEPFLGDAGKILENVRVIRQRAAARALAEGKKPTSANSWIPPEQTEIVASIRRLAWNVDYFLNGSKRSPFQDPTFEVKDTGESLHGWYRDSLTGRVERADSVFTM